MIWVLNDSWALTRRELDRLRHAPGQLVGIVAFPTVMVLLFGYVFGSAIAVPGNYREFLMPGLFAMTALTGVVANALQVSKDAAEGVLDRFRSMPMARAAVPLGRLCTDLLTSVVGLAMLSVVGLAVGWRAHDGLARAAAAYGLILLMRFALSWAGVLLGLSVTPEAADSLVPLFLPLSMLSNSFVPTGAMPGWLRLVTEWNPLSALVQACRQLFGNPSAVAAHPSFPLAHPYLVSVGWSALLVAVFMPLAVRAYARLDD